MPNGGHICCVECAFNRCNPGKCDVYGVPTGAFTICRMFRLPKQSHTEAREHWNFLDTLKPGKVYSIENSTIGSGNPKISYKMVKEERNKNV
ncbi:MAG: hypothetical protein HQM08_29755 [Candidatus Riflebacteria bacterium]|nr:hypothetical protein [Candidatus Riflebacteria bacterium]